MSPVSLPGPLGANQYQKLQFLKRGGMGEIWTAVDTSNSQTVAIKIVSITDPSLLDLLTEEGKIATTLKDPNIIDTYYAGTFADGAVTNFYMVMEMASSGSLADLLRSRTAPLGIAEATDILVQIASGMSAAHKLIVHRDLKPDNVLIGDSGILKISDFGLSRYITAATRTKTFKGWGTYPYMSPECWLSDANTAAMDVYSMGIIFFEILAGKLPYTGKTENEWRDHHLYDPLPDLRVHRKGIPDRLVDCISKMSNKRPAERYGNASEVLNVLKEIRTANPRAPGGNDPLVAQALGVVQQHEAQSLELKRQKDLLEQETKLYQASINGLFSFFERRIGIINAQIEQRKVDLSITPGVRLRAQFMGNSLTIGFFDRSGMAKYISERKNRSIENQRKHWGMVMQEVEKSVLESEGIMLVGIVETTKPHIFGANLLLRKATPDDLYGEWWLAWFDDSALLAKTNLDHHYALREREFYHEYELCRHAMHIRSVTVKKLEPRDVEELLSKIIS